MAAIKIKRGGGKATSAKTTAKKGSTATKKSRGASKGRTTSARKGAAKKPQAAASGPTPRQKELAALVKQFEKPLKNAGQAVTDTREAHEEAVNDLYEIAQVALGDGVPMMTVSNLTGISRQWLYKMGEHRERSNGSRPARRSSAKRSSTKRSSSTTASKKRSTKKAGAKRSVKISRKRK